MDDSRRERRSAGRTSGDDEKDLASAAPIRVLVVRDEGYFGVPIRELLTSAPEILYVATLPLRPSVVEEAMVYYPTVIILDTEYMISQVMPITAELHGAMPDCKILMLCDPAKRGMLPPRRRAGHLNFLLKDASRRLLVDSVRRLAAGDRIANPLLQSALLYFNHVISTREIQVLGLSAEGESIEEIAGRLYLSGGTVRNYLSSVITKTGARNRLDAIRIARKDGWLR